METQGQDQVQGRPSGGEPSGSRSGSPAHKSVDEALRLFSDLERQMVGLRESLTEQEQENERARQREAELADRVNELVQREAEVKRQHDSVKARQAQLAHEAEQLGARKQELDDLTNAVESQRADMDLGRLRAEEQARAQEEQQRQQARELEQRQAGLDEREQRLAAQAASISRDRQAAEGAAAEVAEKLRAAAEERDRLVGSKESELAGLKAKLSDSEKQASAAAGECRRLAAQIQEAGPLAEKGKKFDAELSARDALLAEMEGHAREAERQLSRLRSEAGASGERAAKVAEQLAEREARIAALEAHVAGVCEELEQERSARRAEAEGGEAEARGVAGGALAQRRSRLGAVRRAVRARADKVRQAGEAVRQRFEQAEQILAQREQVHASKLALVEAHQRVRAMEAKAAKGRAAGGMFYAVATLGVLAGLSWAISGQVTPSMFAASAEIRPDTQGRDVTDEQLAEWGRVHEELVSDPQLMQEASERMRMRGIATLSTPGELGVRMGKDLVSESAEPGQLRLELKGRGAARTERELGTFVTALVSRSNAMRDRRADGLGTIITEPARAGDSPLDDQRIIYAGAIMGGSSLLCLLAGTVLWRRLASAKSRFEQELAADETGPSAWADAPIARK